MSSDDQHDDQQAEEYVEDGRPWPEPEPVKTRKRKHRASPLMLRKKARDREGARMRVEDGATWDAIAHALGYSDRAHAYRQVTKFLQKDDNEQAETFRRIEEARFEKAYDVIMGVITGDLPTPDPSDGDSITIAAVMDMISKDIELKLRAIDKLATISGRRGKMWGFDAPTQLETTGAQPFAISVNPNLLPPQAIEALAKQNQ